MSKTDLTKLSAMMADALDFARRHGGELIRHAGGYWTYRNCPRSNGIPDEHFGAQTIIALVARKRMTYTEFKRGRYDEPFPIAARIVEEEAVAA